MIAAAMSYTLAISLLLTVAAFAIERCLATLRQSRRIVWIATMTASVAVLLLALARGALEHASASAAAGRQAPIDQAIMQARAVFAWMPSPSWPVWNGLDAGLIAIWTLVSAAMALTLAIATWRLHQRLRTWPISILNEQAIRVADTVGPAVFGIFKARIIAPRWLLDAPEAVRTAALQHEQQHVAARDGLLFACALALLSIAPWNPLLWLQLRRLRFAIEIDCDARMLKSGIEASAYGEALLAVVQAGSNTPIAAIALAEPVSHLERRIRIMLLDRPKRPVFGGLVFLALATAPVAYAASLQPPAVPVASTASDDTRTEVVFSSNRAESWRGGALLVWVGDVRVDVPASVAIEYSADRITRQAGGAQVLEGAVLLIIEQSRISTERAVITQSADGGAVISMDRAEVVRAR